MIHCKKCKEILEAEGIKGMQKRGYKPKSTFIRKRRNYTHGHCSRPYTTLVVCKNCNCDIFIEG